VWKPDTRAHCAEDTAEYAYDEEEGGYDGGFGGDDYDDDDGGGGADGYGDEVVGGVADSVPGGMFGAPAAEPLDFPMELLADGTPATSSLSGLCPMFVKLISTGVMCRRIE